MTNSDFYNQGEETTMLEPNFEKGLTSAEKENTIVTSNTQEREHPMELSELISQAVQELQSQIGEQEQLDSEIESKVEELNEAKARLEEAVEEFANALGILENLDSDGLRDALEDAENALR